MAINLVSTFSPQPALPLDDRTLFATLTAMNALATVRRYEGLQCFCLEDSNYYKLNSSLAWVKQDYISTDPVFNSAIINAGLNIGDYKLSEEDGSLNIECQNSDSPSVISIMPKDKDGTDSNFLSLFAVGGPADENNSCLILGYIDAIDIIGVASNGNGTLDPKNIFFGVAKESDLYGIVVSYDNKIAMNAAEVLIEASTITLNAFSANPSILLKGSDKIMTEEELTGHANKSLVVNSSADGISYVEQPVIISENTTVTVGSTGCDFTTIQDALDSLNNIWLTSQIIFTIEVSNEIFNIEDSIRLTHPKSDLVHIVGVPFETDVVDIEVVKDTGQTFAPSDVNVTTNTITIVGHGFQNGDPVYFESTGDLPEGIDYQRVYSVKNKTDDTFQLRFFLGTIDITTQGTGTLTVKKYDAEMTITIDSGDTLPANIVGKYIKLNRGNFWTDENIGAYKITERLSDTTLKAKCSPWQNDDTNVYPAKILTTVRSSAEYAVLVKNNETIGLIDNIAFEADYTVEGSKYGICAGEYEGYTSEIDINTIGGSLALGSDVHADGFAVGYMATMGGKLECSGTSAARNFIAGYGALLNGVIAAPTSSANESFFYGYFCSGNSCIIADQAVGCGGEYGIGCQAGFVSASSAVMQHFASYCYAALSGKVMASSSRAKYSSFGYLSFFCATIDASNSFADNCSTGYLAAYNGAVATSGTTCASCGTDYDPLQDDEGNLGGINVGS